MPNGKPTNEVTKYVIMIFFPAEICEKQNLTWSNLLTLSRKGMYWPKAKLHNATMSQKVPLNYFKSLSLIV